ncbi:MAG: DASS family sodium-coupled anion symporter [Acidobacteria bacterium]|nr:DASS family sodium-coupled anion symporter [Acidobacteriota bacterium]MYG74301.1 DASS family sodium-coupled anion symporter [Acidobacteriota bacterium]
MKRERIGLVLGLALLVGITVVPIPGIPDEARRMLAVAAIMATWWVTEAAPLAVTSLLPLVLLPAFGITNAAGAAAPYANHLVYLFLGGFMIAQAMQRWNLHRRIALRTVMAMGSSPPRLVLGFMVASALLSMWVSNTATTAMMMPIGVAVIAEISRAVHGPKRPAPGDFPFAVCLMLGCAYGASIGGFSTLIGTPPNVFLAGFLEEQLGIQITFVRWLAFAMPLTILFLPLTWLWLTKVAFPIRIRDIPGGREPVRTAYAALGPLSTPERRLAVLFGGTALAWMFRPVWTAFLPDGGFITDSTIAMAATVLCFLVPAGSGSGERILNWDWGVRIPWDVLILIGGGFSLANGLDVSGLSAFLGDRLADASALPLPLFLILVVVFIILLTELASNLAATALMVPILAAVAASAGIPPLILLVPVTVAASCAFMLPAATPPNAIVFGTGHFTIPQMVRAGIGVNIIGAVLTCLFAVFWVPVVFG